MENMNKPKTNAEAMALVLEIVGNPARLAEGLGLTRQLTSRWKEIPPDYAARVAEITKLPLDWILPELDASVSKLLGKPASPILAALIRIFYPYLKGSIWADRKTKKAKPKR